MKNSNHKRTKIFRGKVLSIFILLGILLAIYISFFLDFHLRWGLKKILTDANCAQVDIQSVETDLKNASFKISDIRITNYHVPEENLLHFDEISLSFLWDGLLRKKFIIEKSKINELSFHKTRPSKGRVYPVCKENQIKESGIDEKIKNEKEKIFEDNVIAGLISLLQGDGNIKEKIKNIKLDLKTQKRIQELEVLISQKEKQWTKEYEELKDFSDVKKLYDSAKSLKISDNPIELATTIKQAISIQNEAQEKVKNYESKITALRSDINNFKDKTLEINQLVKEDTLYLKKYFNIPDVNLSTFSQDIFKSYIDGVVAPYMRYWHTFKRKIPQVNKKDDNKLEPKKRDAGITYHYPRTKSYPSFWLKNLELTSKSQLVKSNEKTTYTFSGNLLDFSSDERIVGRPMSFKLDGSLPVQQIKGINIDGTVARNYETGKYESKIKGAVNSYPVKLIKLGNSSKFKLQLTDAIAKTTFEGGINGAVSDLKLRTAFQDINWIIETQKEKVTKILKSVLDKIPDVSLKSFFSGNFLKPKIDISSDFDMRFKDGIQKFIGEKLKEGELKLRKIVDEKISAEKKRFFNKLGSTEKGLLAPLLASENNLLSMQGAIQKIRTDFEAQQKQKAKQKVETEINKGINKIKDKLKIDF